MKKTNFFKEAGVVASAVLIGFLLTVAVSKVGAWTEPTVTPPGGNVGAPINTSTYGQIKTGNLTIRGLSSLGPPAVPYTYGLLVENGNLIALNGNVGIGTTAPSAKLEVYGSRPITFDPGQGNVRIKGTSGGWAFSYGAKGNSGTDRGGFGFLGSADALTYYYIGDSYAAPKLVVRGDNVGIGTASPAAKLDVNGLILSRGYVQAVTGFCIGGSCIESWPSGLSGTGTANYIPKWNGVSSLANSQIYDNGTNVGIATSNAPTHKFDLRGQMRQTASSTYDLWIQGGSATSGDDRNLAILGVDEDSGDRLYVNHGTEYANGVVIGGNTVVTGNLYSPIMYDSGNGSYYVDPAGNSFMGNIYLNGRYLYFGSSGTHYIYTDNSSALYYRGNHDTVVQQIFLDKQGTVYGRIYGITDGSYFGTLDGDGNWSLQMQKDTATRFLINNATELTITPTELNGAGNIITNFTAYYYTSDERLKENIQPVGSALDKILRLKGVRFNWKENGEIGVGFSAQKVEEVFPELVRTDEDGYKSVQYGNLTAPIVEAIKQQQEMIEEQKRQIEDLRNEVNQLKGL